MGLLLEGLWGYYPTECLADDSLEMAWLVDHQYNDFVAGVGAGQGAQRQQARHETEIGVRFAS